ncbi:rCG61659 [Rattus norvegicus]|uniref:RCG61659 n=1 Tax=Rattus norvegicus TaxID=10116 RepID=A6HAF5_RAT|nr:rCG61659 [Rattus norvegicus]
MVRLSSCLCPAICFRADCQRAVSELFPPRLNMQKRVSRCFVTVCAKC